MPLEVLYRGEVKTVPDVLIYQDQEFNLKGVRPHFNLKGQQVMLVEWQGVCRDCGSEYVTARTPTKSAQPALRCEECRR